VYLFLCKSQHLGELLYIAQALKKETAAMFRVIQRPEMVAGGASETLV
jgi:hypothetical protein